MSRPAPFAPLEWTIPKRPLGAHMSIAGGMETAVERAVAVGATALQVFTKSSNQWAARPFSEGEPGRFRAAVRTAGLLGVVAHDSYLINLCSPDDILWERSVEACALELERSVALGIPWLVTHPGGHMGRGEDFGIARMAEAIDRIHARVPGREASIALETTAGQGTILGHRFEQIAAIFPRLADPGRPGVCLDTCHVFAAGYDLRTPETYDLTMRRFDETIGLERLIAVHVNDSKQGLGSRVDRHEHIGRGHLGLETFRSLMNDPRLLRVPLLLETPKGEDGREDVANLTRLVGLAGESGRTPRARGTERLGGAGSSGAARARA